MKFGDKATIERDDGDIDLRFLEKRGKEFFFWGFNSFKDQGRVWALKTGEFK